MESPTSIETRPEKIPVRIKVLRAINPLIARLLGSRLHGLLSRDLLVLHFRGLRSGRSFATPLSYAEQGGRLYLCTRPEVARWWTNLRPETSIEIDFRGLRVPARARVLEASSEEAAAGFRAFLVKNPGTASLLYRVAVGRDGSIDEAALRRSIRGSVVVQIEPGATGESSGA